MDILNKKISEESSNYEALDKNAGSAVRDPASRFILTAMSDLMSPFVCLRGSPDPNIPTAGLYGMFHGHTRKLLKKKHPPQKKKQGGFTQGLPGFATPKYQKKMTETALSQDHHPSPPRHKKKTPDHPRSHLQELPESQSWGLWVFFYISSSWWLNQPNWKICGSQIGSVPQSGVKIKNVSNHHLVFISHVSYPHMKEHVWILMNSGWIYQHVI